MVDRVYTGFADTNRNNKRMKLFLDSADSRQWELPSGCPPIHGITTNPALILDARLPVTLDTYLAMIADAVRCVPEIMLQLPRPNAREAREWLGHLSGAAGTAGIKLTIKLPCHADWLPVINEVHEAGLPLLLTGLSNPMQLLWAKSQRAQYVAPYFGRIEAEGREIECLAHACIALQAEGLQLLAASIREADLLSRLIGWGAYAATIKPEFAAGLASDPITDAAITNFDIATERSMAFASPTKPARLQI